MGAKVTGLDPGEENILAARAHAEPQNLDIDYRIGLVEDLVAAGGQFDAVLCLEVVEHVPDASAFVKTCSPRFSRAGQAYMQQRCLSINRWAGWPPIGRKS